uniref:Membrane insertase YidC/Oxa/ALB C-terminal domain-containing protein n=1 Tax=Phaseolus vulgaris TaxID=3885 RepID=V7CPW2_PHAVU|nr:hypothetical protein PHAVU_002G225700g [Phaseolus vulgaris]ESW31285.1 hypothetical protein PHAVU_002G225700g [Phaseolus vulgaris]
MQYVEWKELDSRTTTKNHVNLNTTKEPQNKVIGSGGAWWKSCQRKAPFEREVACRGQNWSLEDVNSGCVAASVVVHVEEDSGTLDNGKPLCGGQSKGRYGVSPFTPLKGLFIQGPIFVSFFLAISNMAEKVPSFKHGGAYWFTDLSTPDTLYVLPVLTALSFLITVECNMQEGMEGNPVASTMKNVSRGLAVLTVPFTMGFPKAIFCYWVTSNLFSLVYGLALKVPGVKKTLGIPEIPVTVPTSGPQSPFSIFPALKQATSATSESSSVIRDEPLKHSNTRISSSSVISQRLRSLEKQVKGRKTNK